MRIFSEATISESNLCNLCLYTDYDTSLPRPLSPAEEREAIERCDRGILIERNLRLVVYIAKRFENT